MPEQNEYFDKFLESRFQHIDETSLRIEKMISEIKTEVKEENETTRREVKAENKATRWWTMGTAITVLLGLAAILLTFVQIQNSWMQQVISFVGKAIVK